MQGCSSCFNQPTRQSAKNTQPESVDVTCMVRRGTARRIGSDENSLRKCIRPLVENGLRAHDDDPRVPVLVNRDGHERPVLRRRFTGTLFDCFFVLPVLLQTSGKRTSKSLRLAGNCKNRHRVIVLSTRQHRPTDPSQLVGSRHDHDVPRGSAR